MPEIPDEAREISGEFLAMTDRDLAAPIEGLYLVGSIALGDYKPGRSDIDFVAVTGEPIHKPDLDRLAAIHKTLRTWYPRPWFSGVYVTWRDLERNPAGIGHVPFHLEGRFGTTGGFEANPPVWLTIRDWPVALRGPERPAVWLDGELLRQWSLHNLNVYWKSWLARHRNIVGRGALVLTHQSISWCVPGVLRPHYTIATGKVTSKTGACEYALERFPAKWHWIVQEALNLRSAAGIPDARPFLRRQEALKFLEFVIEDANAM